MLCSMLRCLVIAPLLVVHSFAASAAGASTVCSGYTDTTTGICYELHGDTQLSWSDAINDCRASGSQLAWITNSAENDIIANLMQNSSVTGQVWLAGQLQTLNGQQFYWTWNSDMQPITGQGCYYDNTTAHPLAVPLGQSDLPYRVTSIPSNAMTIDLCKTACLQAGYLFAGVQAGSMCFCGNSYGLYGSVDTSQDNNTCGTVCSGNTAQLCGSNGENFIYQVNGSYSVWSNGRPNNWQGYQTCGILSPSISFKMDDDNCGKPSWPFVCDIPMTRCTNGAQTIHGACYYIAPTSNTMTWFSARLECLARGGELVKISSPDIWSALVSVIASKTSSSSYWIGMTCLRWYWHNGLEIIYSNWYAQSSNNYQPSTLQNKCLLLDPNYNYKWTDGGCDNLNFYVCMSGKYPPSPTTTTTTTPVPTTVTQALTSRATSGLDDSKSTTVGAQSGINGDDFVRYLQSIIIGLAVALGFMIAVLFVLVALVIFFARRHVQGSQKPEQTTATIANSTFTNDLGFETTSPDQVYETPADTLYDGLPTVYEVVRSPTNKPVRPLPKPDTL